MGLVNPEYVRLTVAQVGIAALLVLVNAGISLLLRLELERRLLFAALRMTGQFLLIGIVLVWIFEVQTWYVVVGMGTIMAVVAGVSAVQRTGHRYPGIWLDSVVSAWVSSWILTAIALLAIVKPTPWYQPQYAIPLLGMILGNTLNGVSLGLERFGEELSARRDQVDALLALGADRWEAALPAVRRAVRTGMIPTINAMTVAGIVSLPGMMTGQLLAGVEPMEAVKYQIVILFLIASGTALGTVGVVLMGYRRLFNARQQFLASRLRVVRNP